MSFCQPSIVFYDQHIQVGNDLHEPPSVKIHRSLRSRIIVDGSLEKALNQVRGIVNFFPAMATTSLCPHLLQEYFKRVRDIIEVYKSQIVEFVSYSSISTSLVNRKIVEIQEDAQIKEEEGESAKMSSLLRILGKRMWGLENLITALIEINVDSWLVEEMFHKYVFYIVNEIKRLKSIKGCKCFDNDQKALIPKAIDKFFEICDSWLYSIGTSLGFLTLTIHGSGNALQPINNLLPINRKKDSKTLALTCINNAALTVALCESKKEIESEDRGVEISEIQSTANDITKGSSRLPRDSTSSVKSLPSGRTGVASTIRPDKSDNAKQVQRTIGRSAAKSEPPLREKESKHPRPRDVRQGKKAAAAASANPKTKGAKMKLKLKIPKMQETAVVSKNQPDNQDVPEETPQEINVVVLPMQLEAESGQLSPAKMSVRNWFTMHSFSNGAHEQFSIDSEPPGNGPNSCGKNGFNFVLSSNVSDNIRSALNGQSTPPIESSQPTIISDDASLVSSEIPPQAVISELAPISAKPAKEVHEPQKAKSVFRGVSKSASAAILVNSKPKKQQKPTNTGIQIATRSEGHSKSQEPTLDNDLGKSTPPKPNNPKVASNDVSSFVTVPEKVISNKKNGVVPANGPKKKDSSAEKIVTSSAPSGGFGSRSKMRKDRKVKTAQLTIESVPVNENVIENVFSKIPGLRSKTIGPIPTNPNTSQLNPATNTSARRPITRAQHANVLAAKIAEENSKKTNKVDAKSNKSTMAKDPPRNPNFPSKDASKTDVEMNKVNNLRSLPPPVVAPKEVVAPRRQIISKDTYVIGKSRPSGDNIKLVQKIAVKPRVQAGDKVNRSHPPNPILKRGDTFEIPPNKTERTNHMKSNTELMNGEVNLNGSKKIGVFNKAVQSYIIHEREKTVSLPNILLVSAHTTSHGTLRACQIVKLRRYKSLEKLPARRLSCSVRPLKARVNRRSVAQVRSSQAQTSVCKPAVSMFAIPARIRSRKLVHAASQTEICMNDGIELKKRQVTVRQSIARIPGPSLDKNSSVREPSKSAGPLVKGAVNNASSRSNIPCLTPGTNGRRPVTSMTIKPKTGAAVATVKPTWSNKKPPPPLVVPTERFSEFSIDNYNFQQWTNEWIRRDEKRNPVKVVRVPTKN